MVTQSANASVTTLDRGIAAYLDRLEFDHMEKRRKMGEEPPSVREKEIFQEEIFLLSALFNT
ncbi:hypothetical protein BpHYR1_049104 [Brachionus plicatilis]|uniref:Uncharacterized protein n=1 Tax=Brachionus plicatilis TaxID=10195 RepID=A0A3M7PL58_BRAPC|nr:hypothetical protein BpHYR1_049104 [Brachionus plicatilis]